jgi:alkylation response protein AidB-like acyl-CoA dehydrogenase
MMHKLLFTEFTQRLNRLACEILGPEAVLWVGDDNAPDGAEWPRGYMNSYGFTIGGGTSEIQRNILGERVLGLPKSK